MIFIYTSIKLCVNFTRVINVQTDVKARVDKIFSKWLQPKDISEFLDKVL